MVTYSVLPNRQKQTVAATVTVPGSKSISNRALLLAAFAKGQSCLRGVLFSEDTRACLKALSALDIVCDIDETKQTVVVHGCAGVLPQSPAAVYCRDSGTLTRFLLPMVAAAGGVVEFSASARMSERPLGALLQLLAQQGVQFEYQKTSERMPFVLTSAGLSGGEMTVPLSESSQFLSGLLLAAPLMQQGLQIPLAPGKPYVAMTVEMMRAFGVQVEEQDGFYCVMPGQYQGCDYAIEPDASTASYFFAMAAIAGGEVTVSGIHQQMLQGDTKFLAILAQMGCEVVYGDAKTTVRSTGQLRGIDVDMTGFSDTFMTLAAMAPFADRPMTLAGLAHTRLQESDRVAAIADGLSRLGVKVETGEDWLRVYPSTVHGGEVESYNDHRIAMSLALIGLKTPGVVIQGAEAVAKTCPNYFALFEQALISH